MALRKPAESAYEGENSKEIDVNELPPRSTVHKKKRSSARKTKEKDKRPEAKEKRKSIRWNVWVLRIFLVLFVLLVLGVPVYYYWEDIKQPIISDQNNDHPAGERIFFDH
ncbi:hypothetical protein GCM10008986_02460 [Salinibacillus aidingensis]|uniref:Uncharacterized protein n=1 Tax=Salinibacillus aidingensis TaxID=237684 RepID=A0ABN1APJ6_9BACI